MRDTQGQIIRLKNYTKPDYKVLTVDLDIKLHPTETLVTSKLVMERASGTMASTPVKLDGDELELISFAADGNAVEKAELRFEGDTLIFDNPPKKRKFVLEIQTRINPTANTKLMGLYRSGGNYCTQCEAEGFRRITYFLDRPDVLSVYTTRIEADKSEAPILLGNGNPVKKGSAGKGRHYAIWHDPHPKPCYLFALVGGDLGSIHKPFKTMSGHKVKLGIYVEKGKEESAHYAMDSLVRSMRWDEEVFGCEYDLDVFNIVAVSDFNMGAMENKGLNIFNDKYVLANPETATDTDYANIEAIVAHEYFHNWTGNRITCRDWFQLCLKEGLTVFRDQEFSSDQRSRPVKRIQDVRRLKADQFPEDGGPLAHPVRPETYREINNFYTATVYEKGAELVRMIATILGEKKFRKGMNLYLKRHDGDAATIEDFLTCFEQAGKVDLSQFFLWYRQAGTPLLSVSSKYEADKQTLEIEFEQFLRPTPEQSHKKPMYIPQNIGLIARDGSELFPSGVKGAEFEDGVLHLNKRRQKVIFQGVDQKPILSLNRGFSAPVDLDYRQSNSDLAFLAKYDTDGFGRWQAFQTYATRLLVRNTKSIQKGEKLQADEKLLSIALDIAGDTALEPAYRAALLSIPSENDLAQIIGRNVDPDAIYNSWHHMNTLLGETLEADRSVILSQLETGEEFSPGAEAAGKRSLHALLMRLAVISGSKSALSEISAQYKKATNMTDRYNALLTIVHYHPDKQVREKALADFYKRYKKDHIVLDKWFMVQASRPGNATSSLVRKLSKHEDFTFSNPNRLRSLFAVFAMANPTGFHSGKGSGYKLLAQTIIKVDATNPQVAARLLTTFRAYKSLEPSRRKLAADALKSIRAKKNLSLDTRDILDRTLG